MHWSSTWFLLSLLITLSCTGFLFSNEKIRLYEKILKLDSLNVTVTGNELWRGFLRDCDKRITFSCIQKNVYTYLDNVFIERDNITVFDGLLLTKNNMIYETCPKTENRNDIDENLVDDSTVHKCEPDTVERRSDRRSKHNRSFDDEPNSPLEEITNALREKTIKFLSTRDYEIQLPQFFFESTTMKISPREVDGNGVLLRVDFGSRIVEQQGRIFKRIKKFIQNKLLTSFLALLLIIKLIKVKFMFVLPFLFGVSAAKKLFLKLLLFFVPAFAHIFKLCSSYYASHSTKYHHHHHQIAHHHHHVPVPVPVPTYFSHPHYSHDDDTYNGHDYSHHHLQYRRDMEELKEWGIEPTEEILEESVQNLNHALPGGISSPISGSDSYGLPQYAPNVKPLASTYLDNIENSPHNLAYSGYLNDIKHHRRQQQAAAALSSIVSGTKASPSTDYKNPYTMFAPNIRVTHHPPQKFISPIIVSKGSISREDMNNDDYFEPIIDRLENIFQQLRFYEESCRERLVCSMYKNPAIYAPHSNLVSNELSRDPQELKHQAENTASGIKFYKYLSAARQGQEGGDCYRTYPCHTNNT